MTDFDTYILNALFAAREPALVQLFLVITYLGNTYVIAVLTACIGAVLVWNRRIADVCGLAVSFVGSVVSVALLKDIVARPRPDALYFAYQPETLYAFPSWHATGSLMLFGFLAYLAWKYAPEKRRLTVLVVTTLLIGLIGFSRLYLGLHFVSDVLAGYAVGAVFLTLGISLSERLKHHPIWS